MAREFGKQMLVPWPRQSRLLTAWGVTFQGGSTVPGYAAAEVAGSDS